MDKQKLTTEIIINILKIRFNKDEIAYTETDHKNGIVENLIVIDDYYIKLVFDYYKDYKQIAIKICIDKKMVMFLEFQNLNNIINLLMAL